MEVKDGVLRARGIAEIEVVRVILRVVYGGFCAEVEKLVRGANRNCTCEFVMKLSAVKSRERQRCTDRVSLDSNGANIR
jgi:hypothetical protein